MKLSYTWEEILARYRVAICFRCAAWMLCLTGICCASALQIPATSPGTSHVPVRAEAAPQTQKDASAASAPSPSNAVPAPASVTLENGALTIKANNSDLNQILKDVASESGMSIDGDIRGDRVYGVYGPGKASDVLTDLLTGSGYNFIMVGAGRQGAPRKLLLSLQNGGFVPASSPKPAVVANEQHENKDVHAPEEEPLAPGVIAHVPPPPSEDPQERAQQNLQRLQHMHEQQQSQSSPR